MKRSRRSQSSMHGFRQRVLLQRYVAAKKIAKKAVGQAQQWERKRSGEKLNTGQKSVFKIAEQMAKERQDMVGVNCLKDESGNILVNDGQ